MLVKVFTLYVNDEVNYFEKEIDIIKERINEILNNVDVNNSIKLEIKCEEMQYEKYLDLLEFIGWNII
jgi:hypothetical protein